MVSVRPFGDNAGGQTGVKIKQVFTPVHETTWLWRKLHPKFCCFSVRVQTCCTGLPPRLPIKEIPGEPGFLSAASDGHRHTPRDHNLNYTIWTLYAESVGFPVNVTLLWGTPTPIYQATWDAPTPIINLSSALVRALSNLSSKLGSAHSNLSNYLGPVQSNNLEFALSNLSSNLGCALSNLSNILGRALSNLSSNLGRPHLPTNQVICPELKLNIRIANSQQ